MPINKIYKKNHTNIFGALDSYKVFTDYWCPLKIFGDFRDFYFLGQPIYWSTSSLLVAVKGQNMPQNSKYSHPRLGLCRVRDGIFNGQPLLPLKRGLVFRQ